MGILTNEAMFDPTVLRGLMSARLRALDVDVRFNTEVVDIEPRDNGFELTSGGSMKARYTAR